MCCPVSLSDYEYGRKGSATVQLFIDTSESSSTTNALRRRASVVDRTALEPKKRGKQQQQRHESPESTRSTGQGHSFFHPYRGSWPGSCQPGTQMKTGSPGSDAPSNIDSGESSGQLEWSGRKWNSCTCRSLSDGCRWLSSDGCCLLLSVLTVVLRFDDGTSAVVVAQLVRFDDDCWRWWCCRFVEWRGVLAALMGRGPQTKQKLCPAVVQSHTRERLHPLV